MEIFFARSWKPLALRGLVALLFGLVAFVWPAITLYGLVVLFGVYALLDGLLAIAAATRQSVRTEGWSLAFEGLVGLAIGLAAIVWTRTTAIVVVDVIAIWAILTGALELAAAVRLRRVIPGEILLGFAGAISLCLGLAMLAWPRASAFVLVMLLGSYAIFFGAAILALAARLRRLTTPIDPFHPAFRSRHGTA